MFKNNFLNVSGYCRGSFELSTGFLQRKNRLGIKIGTKIFQAVLIKGRPERRNYKMCFESIIMRKDFLQANS
jgi:hypothetical protein